MKLDLLSKISDEIDYNDQRIITGYLNLYNYTLLREQPELLKEVDVFTLDGIALTYLLNIVFKKKIIRKSPDFSSYFSDLFSCLEKTQKTLFFIGGNNEEILEFKSILIEKHPSLKIKGFTNGYNLEELRLFKQIKDLNPDVVFLGLGTPKQELLAVKLKDKGFMGSCYVCGAFISQTANKGIEYYPKIINKIHLRWLYRIYKEPKLFPRYLFKYPKGLFYFIKDNV